MTDEQPAAKADSLAELVDRWACTGCGWAHSAPLKDRERSMELVLAHEFEGKGGHPVVKVGDTAGRGRGRWASRKR